MLLSPLILGPYSAPNLDSKQSSCLSLSPVSGCTSVDSGPLSSSSFQCSACSPSTHYLTGSPPICEFRTLISHCLEYNPLLNECSKCDTGFFLSSSNSICSPNPVGIPNCIMHDKSGIRCLHCENNFYLQGLGESCAAILPEEQVNFCISYDQSKRCIKCLDNYLHTAEYTCEEITAQNCLTFAKGNICETCQNMFILDPTPSSDPRSCTPLSISNCIKNEGEKCLVCDSNMKPSGNGNSCNPVSTLTPNCSAYNSNSDCIECETPFIFDPVSKSCLIETTMEKFLDPNCKNFKLSPQCNTCKEGYYFSEAGVCTECKLENCHFCSRNGEKCNLCKTNFYMDQNSKCLQNSQVQFDSFEAIDTVTENQNILKMIWSFVFLGLFFVR